MLIPTVSVGKPEKSEAYRKMEIDNITIYLAQTVIQKPGTKAVINLHGFWLFKELEVKGLACS